MGQTIDFENGIIIQRDGPSWWPPLWLHRFIDKHIRKRRTLRGKWRMVECEPTIMVCELVDEDAEHILLECISDGLK